MTGFQPSNLFAMLALLFTAAAADGQVISSFSPLFAGPGEIVVLQGSGFTGASAVQFSNGKSATFTVTADTQISATVPSGTVSGPIGVLKAGNLVFSVQSFTAIGPGPFVVSFTPTTGNQGAQVTFAGVHFTGVTSVNFNGVAASSISITADTQLQAVVPAGATSGPITVTSPAGSWTTSVPFYLPPSVSSFSPTVGLPGTAVTINGTSFLNASAVRFNGVSAPFTVDTATRITATVPAGTSSGAISVTAPAGGAASSGSFTVLVPPTITTQPASQTVALGSSVTFTVSASSATTYQWRFRGANISGATESSYTKSNLNSSDSGDYDVIVSNAAGSVTSSSAFLSVETPPAITSQPQSRTVNAGVSATFSTSANGSGPLNYQWRRNGANISGATGSSYTLASPQAADSGSTFNVRVSNAVGSATSSSATLTVNAPPSIVSQPSSSAIFVSQTATFTVTASGSPSLSYQWRKNGANISGATSASYSIANAQTTHAGSYSVVVSNPFGSVTSGNATLTVNVPVAPSFTTQPQNQTVNVGQTATFSAAAVGSTTPTYQWRKNGVNISGATSASYSIANAQTTHAGSYDVLVSTLGISANSSSATLTVNAPPAITSQPQSRSATVGLSVMFAVQVTGIPAPALQWRKDGTPIQGATSATLTLSSVQFADAGAYDLLATNSVGNATSSSATLTVTLPPVISSHPQNRSATLGQSATLSVTATGTGTLTYQWQKDGVNVAGATQASFTIASVQVTSIGDYAVLITDAGGSITSSAASLTIPGIPTGIWRGLVAYYPFTGNANDASGNGHHGTVSGAVLASDRFGTAGRAYSFAGGSTRIEIVASPFLASDQGTVAFWVKANSWLTSDSFADLVGKDGTTGRQWVVQASTDGRLRVAVFTTMGEFTADSAQAMATGTWHHIVQTWDGTNEVAFVNGTQVLTIPAPGPMAAGSNNLRIGGNPVSGTSLDGLVDDVRIYNRSLSAADVLQLAASEAVSPVISSPPQSRVVTIGGNTTFSISATGSEPLTYQWRKDGNGIVGATNSSYSLTSIGTNQVGSYWVVVSNVAGSVTSAPPALLQVVQPPPASVVAWGYNTSGQTSVPLGLVGVTAVAVGDRHTVALKADGTVVAWGDNSVGQTTVPLGLSGVMEIAAGGNQTVALKRDGTVVAWGSNSHGQTSVPPGLSGVTAIAAGVDHTLALRNDGTVVAWGYDYDGQTTGTPSTNSPYTATANPVSLNGVVLSGVSAIAGGVVHTVALKSNGTVVAWGWNGHGQISVPPGLSGVTAIAAGYNHTVALKNDGTVVAWGEVFAGGDSFVPAAAPAGLNGVIAIEAGWNHTVALKSDRTVVAWGWNGAGQTSVPSGLKSVTAIGAGWNHTAAVVGLEMSTTLTGNNLTLLWTEAAIGYRVESALSLSPPALWSNEAGSFLTNGGNVSLVVPISGTRKFYRLAKP